MKFTKQCILFFILSVLTILAFAGEGFIVRSIRVSGLQGISKETILNYLPVQVGERFEVQQSGEVVRALYATGFFENVSVEHEGSSLIINVVERPVISSVLILGNDSIPQDKLDLVLKDVGLVKGRVFKPAILANMKQMLTAEFQRQGKEKATVDTTVKPLERHRVAITILIKEGKATKIDSITFKGNHAFSNSELTDKFTLTTSGLFTLITHKDEYSKEKLDESLEAVTNFYFDHGYLRFKIDDSQVNLTPDKKKIALLIKVTEGVQYKIKNFKLEGKFIVPESLLLKLVTLEPGKVFSRQEVQNIIDKMAIVLGNAGYGRAVIVPEPIIDEATKQVTVVFHIDPGNKLYVRQIHFRGNVKTADTVLRREMRQNESAVYSSSKIKESERQLHLLNYFETVTVKTKPVPGTNNQVDLDVDVKELPGAEATASIGYGTDGPVFDINLNQSNFVGTGSQVGVGFKKSKVVQAFNFNYFNPYYTIEGVGRGFDLYYQKSTPGKVDISKYTTEQYGGMVNYIYPLGDIHKLQFGFGYNSLHLLQVSTHSSTQIQNFVAAEGNNFKELKLLGAWVYNTYDQLPFPTQGWRQELAFNLFLPVTSSSIAYYKANYLTHWYLPLYKDFIFNARASLGYGNHLGNTKNFPFFENYFSGGLVDQGMVRGFENYSLGPRDSRDDPLGGNVLLNGGIGLIFPNFISRDKLRTEIFLDVGNVYDWGGTNYKGTDAGPIRYSAGLGGQWNSPLGPIVFSLGTPLNKQDHDSVRVFDFTISIPF